MFKCRPAHKMPQFVCIMLGPRYRYRAVLQAAADSRTGSGSGSGCQLSQNGHKTFTIYHALLRTILATFGACVERAPARAIPASLSRSLSGTCLSLSLPPSPCHVAVAATFCETRNLHMYPRQQQQRERHAAFIWQKLTELLHCKLNSSCLPCSREDIRCPRDVCVMCRRTCCCSHCSCHLSV